MAPLRGALIRVGLGLLGLLAAEGVSAQSGPDAESARLLFDAAGEWGPADHSIDLGIGRRLRERPFATDPSKGDRILQPLVVTWGIASIHHGPQPGLHLDADNTRLRKNSDSTQVNPEEGRSQETFGLWLRVDWSADRQLTFRNPLFWQRSRTRSLRAGAGLSSFIDPRGYQPGGGVFAFFYLTRSWAIVGEKRWLFTDLGEPDYYGLRFRFGG